MKITKLLLVFVLIAALAAPLFLSGCGTEGGNETAAQSDSAAPDTEKSADSTGAADSTANSAADSSTDTAEPEAPYTNPLAGTETIPEPEIKVENDDGGMTMREYKFFKTHLFEAKDGTKYNWFQFYNACVTGKIRLDDAEVLSFAEECFDFFEDNEFAQRDNAETLVNAAKGLIG